MTDATLSAKVTADIADFTQKFDQVRRSIDGLGSSVGGGAKHASSQLSELNEQISTIGTLLTSGALIQGGKAITELVTMPLIGLGRSAITMADNLRRAELAFTTMTGSADRATALLRDLQAFAATTPFEFPQLVEAGKRMLALGFRAEQLIPTLTAVGDATAGLGGGADVMHRIILALGQMQTKGKVASQELKQLAEAGIPAWDLLAQKLGVTVPEAMQLVQKGSVDAATGVSAVLDGMAQKFGGLMAEQSATIQGTMSNLHDTLGLILTDIGRELIETLRLRDALLAVGEFARGVLEWFRSLDEGTKQLVVVLTGVFAASGPILVAVGAFMAALSVITTPMLVGGAIIAGIIAGVTLILMNWQKIKETGIALWQGLTDRVTAIVTALANAVQTHLVERFHAIVTAVRANIEAVKGFFKGLYDAVVGRSYVPDMVDEIGRHMKKLDAHLTAPARRAAISVENVFRGMTITAADLLEDLRERSSYTAGAMIQSLSGAFAGAIQGTTNWAQVGQQILHQFLTNAIGMVLTWTTTWLAGEAMRTAATTTANSVIAASTSATMSAMSAVVTLAMTGLKTIAIGVARTAIGVVSTVIAAITPVLVAVSTVIGTVMQYIGTMLISIGTAMQSIPVIGTVLGAIMIAMGGFAMAAGAALPGVVLGLMSGLAGAVGALGSAIPALAGGGIVTRPTLAMIGEAGPEAVVPLSRGAGFDRRPTTIVVELDGRPILTHVTNHLPSMLRLKGLPA